MNILSENRGIKCSQEIKKFRAAYGFTQESLANSLGVSFATVNRWENGQTRPSKLSWNQLRQFEQSLMEKPDVPKSENPSAPAAIDFTAEPAIVKILAEGERLSFGHLTNPAFGTEISNIDPLPHQRIAVYDHMLKQPRLRFLLADDAGAGKTIMTGLYIREQLSRRLLKRILIVSPAGLIGNWRRELATLFKLSFKIILGGDARNDNPFADETSNQAIISMDTLAIPRMFHRLIEPEVQPYDLIVFDEAHKLAADRGNDLRIRKTDRYCLAEAIAGVKGLKPEWTLKWSAQNLLFLTATPHMGKDYPYYALWRLLEPDILSTPEAFQEFPADQRCIRFIRRTKEEMVYPDGRAIYPKRISDTLAYDLSQGEISEQRLYDETTEYLRYVYNKAKMLNREAARLAMSVFQRRLASSTFALMRSFERRLEKLDALILDVQDGKLTNEQLCTLQQRLRDEDDVLEHKGADEEQSEGGLEENQIAEETLLQGVIAASLTDLLAEKEQVKQLLDLARKVLESGVETKFEKVNEIIRDAKYSNEKLILFTEHRDTLEYITKRLSGMGFTGQVARIHGGMDFNQREIAVDRFRRPLNEGGARFLVCTDAAGEGINLQFCWIMINYDVPWNPARLEQRMGRIHRYGQKHDPVIILNLVAPKTREGKVLSVLLDKLEKIRKELKSDKVFDVIGRMFQGVSIKQYMEIAVTEGAEGVAAILDGQLTKEQVLAIEECERKLYGTGGDVKTELPRLREDFERETYLRLLPGYVLQYIENAAPRIGLSMQIADNGFFTFRTLRSGALDTLFAAMEIYTDKARTRFTVNRPSELDRNTCIWLHPGEPIFEAFRSLVKKELGEKAQRGAIFIDPLCDKPYLFHLAEISIVRKADPDIEQLLHEETIECRMVGVRQFEGADIELCSVEHLLMLKNGVGLPASAQRLAAAANVEKEHVNAYLTERISRELALNHKKRLLDSLPERESYVQKGYNFREAELASARAMHAHKARSGNKKAEQAFAEIKEQQRNVALRKEETLMILNREPELIGPGQVNFIAHALVVPSTDPDDLKEIEANSELIAMKLAQAFEEASGATVTDVHSPDLARKAGLGPHPGFDFLSVNPNGERRAIEVKGRLGTGEVQVYDNEWAKACNLRDKYWLFVAYDCATANPRLIRVQDPFGKLLARQFSTTREEERMIKGMVYVGGVKVSMNQLLKASEL